MHLEALPSPDSSHPKVGKRRSGVYMDKTSKDPSSSVYDYENTAGSPLSPRSGGGGVPPTFGAAVVGRRGTLEATPLKEEE